MKFGLYTKGAVEKLIAQMNRDNKLFQSVFKYFGKDMPFNRIDNPQSQVEQGYIGNTIVYSIVNRVISMAMTPTLKLYKTKDNGELEEITKHHLLDIVKKPNPYTTYNEYMSGWLIYYMTIGNVFQYKLAPKTGINKGIPQQIFMMPSYDVEVLASGNWMSPISGYRVNMTSEKFEFEEVQHDKMFNPLYADENEVYGLSPIRVASNKILKYNEADLAEARSFKNQGPPVIVYREGDEGFTDPQKRGLEGDFNKRKGGKNAGLPWFTGLNKINVKQLGISPVDLAIIESNQQTLRDLAAIWGWPSQLLNDPNGTTYNNVETARKEAWVNCTKPKMDIFAQGLTQFLIDQSPIYRDENMHFAYDYSNVPEMQEDIKEKVSWMKDAYWTPNEIREATGKDKIDSDAMNQPQFNFSSVTLEQYEQDLNTNLTEEDQKGLDNYK